MTDHIGAHYDSTTGETAPVHYSSVEHETTITPIEQRLPYHVYAVDSLWSKDSVNMLAQSLLDIADYVAANRERLEQEVQSDSERNERAMNADMVDMHRIRQEWDEYKHTDAKGIGDETPGAI